MKKYRDNGAVGALLDEYERAIFDLFETLKPISQAQFLKIVDEETEDADCRSIQTILTHVVSAGYNYACSIQNKYVSKCDLRDKVTRDSVEAYVRDIREMFEYTEQLFAKNPSLPIEINIDNDKMLMSWGQIFDIDQLMEHAIVHILRHRRQIERFLLKMAFK